MNFLLLIPPEEVQKIGTKRRLLNLIFYYRFQKFKLIHICVFSSADSEGYIGRGRGGGSGMGRMG